ncbi:DUF6702 family protein [uncultured Microscilla sp.]|uniref:DUF6702 family protein n=1 Tax=uncultured Microscilla sp. TaxID=432653 RepID=UPI00260B1549|nr:DUF6702 family protein [uncultured Microscilla sp.]
MKLLFIIALSSWLNTTLTHPLKVSVSEMTIGNNQRVVIETRLFLDDLTDHISQTYRLLKPTFHTVDSEGTKALQRYINQRFYLAQNNQPNRLKITHTRFSEDKKALIVRLVSRQALRGNQPFRVKNTLFFDVFKKQKNLVNVSGTHQAAHAFSLHHPWWQVK